MTRRILLALTASVLLVIVAFLVPLWAFVGEFAVDRAQRLAVLKVQPLIAALGPAQPGQARDLVTAFQDSTGYEITVYYADGTVLGTDVPADAAVELAKRGGAFFQPVDGGRDLLAPVASTPNGEAVLRMHVPDSDLLVNVTSSRLVLLGLGLGLLGLAVLVGLLLARSFLRPIEALSDTAESLAAGDLSARVKPDGPQEIRNVGQSLNRLATRVTELLRGEREQAADLAHRLRTPVTALRLDVDLVDDPDARERLTDDVNRLERMVDEVIREARRPVREGVMASCDAGMVVRDRAGFWAVLAEDQGRAVRLAVPALPLRVRVDGSDLGDALDALVGNVFAHTPDGTPYAITVAARHGGGALVTVDDAGDGLPAHDVVERGRSGAGSTGLGLDIARRTAESSGGELRVGRSPEGGARVELVLGPPLEGAAGQDQPPTTRRSGTGRRARQSRA